LAAPLLSGLSTQAMVSLAQQCRMIWQELPELFTTSTALRGETNYMKTAISARAASFRQSFVTGAVSIIAPAPPLAHASRVAPDSAQATRHQVRG